MLRNAACFIVRNATGQALGYFYFEDEPGHRSAAKLLTRFDAQRLVQQLRPRILRVAAALVQHRYLTADQIARIIGW